MAYQALYRKYRPSTFSEVYGQEHITEVLKSELSSDKISHAYLFTGTRGTGKTTCAKILAKAANCLNNKDGNPCNECEMCKAINDDTVTDICEIDAASNNGVNDIRTLREQVNFTPSVARFRVYIIDEVHMLSTAAFNALLKTLEEPPKHVIFILATTEVHKLPATILSRCQRFDFRRIDPEKICERIQFIAEKEGFKVSPEAASLIAATADGGMRDALSILDLCASVTKDITEDTVVSVCAMAGNEYLLKFADHIKNRDVESALLLINELHNSSIDMMRLVSEITSHFRDLMIAKTVKDKTLPIVCSAKKLEMIKKQAEDFSLAEILSILEVLRDTAAKMQSGSHRTRVEMMIIRLCKPELGNSVSSLEQRIAALEAGKPEVSAPKPVKAEEKAEPEKKAEKEAPEEKEIKETKPEEPKGEPETDGGEKDGKPLKEWEDILAKLRISCPIIAGVLKGSKAYLQNERLLIDSKNEQFRSLINADNSTYRDAIKKASFDILGKRYNLGPYKKSKVEQDDGADPLAAFARQLDEL
ncbi:MAG: DNA polymerase III subunit gamma/tau [Clostridia bacterium]|nr:DNA polymerase III subunit gamma/tau [Clostridia bacterium]